MSGILKAIILCTFGGALVSSSCANEVVPARSSDEVTITQAQDSQKVTAQVGSIIRVRLESSLGTGYRWQLVDSNREVLREETAQIESKDKELGGSSVQEFRFRAIAAGSSPLRLEYKRPWEQKKEPARTFSASVEVRQAQR